MKFFQKIDKFGQMPTRLSPAVFIRGILFTIFTIPFVVMGETVPFSGSSIETDTPGEISAIIPFPQSSPKYIAYASGQEIFCASTTGTIVDGWPKDVGCSVAGITIGGPIDAPTIYAANVRGEIFGWDFSGKYLPGWPKDLESFVTASPLMMDWDEGCVVVPDWGGRVWCWDLDGTVRPGWPVTLDGRLLSEATVLSKVGEHPNIVVASEKGTLWAIKENGDIEKGFPRDLGTSFVAAPFVADIDGDGVGEICIGGKNGNAWLLDESGQVLSGWPVSLNETIGTKPSVGDFDGDGLLEIVWAGRNGTIGVFGSDGVMLSGWPRKTKGMVSCSPSVIELDKEVGPIVILFGKCGWGYAWGGDGEKVVGWPRWLGIIPRVSPVSFKIEDTPSPFIAMPSPTGMDIVSFQEANSLPDESAAQAEVFEETSLSSRLSFGISPNPVLSSRGSFQIRLVVPGNTKSSSIKTKVDLYDVSGRHVGQIFQGELSPGQHLLSWSPRESLSSGVYLVRAVSGEQATNGKLLILE